MADTLYACKNMLTEWGKVQKPVIRKVHLLTEARIRNLRNERQVDSALHSFVVTI
jgi:hypothetical protein